MAEENSVMKKFTDYKDNIEDFQRSIKRMATEMARGAGKSGCHIGGSFSCIEIFSVLYGGILNYDVSNPSWEERDRFIPSKTHCVLSNFPALVKSGYLKEEDLPSFHKDGGLLAGHPWNVEIGLEFAGGSLGMGIGVAVGLALAAKRFGKKYKTYVLLGDGESNEGSVWEAFMSASQYKLDNLVVIVDYDNMQFDGRNDNIMSLAPLKDKLVAFGFETVEVDGHNVEDLWNALNTEHVDKPLAIVAKTLKAHGVPSLEDTAESHYASLSDEDYEYLLKSLKGEDKA